MSDVAKVKFTDYDSSVAKALDLIEAAGKLPQDGLIIIKPNLTNADGPPVTTNVSAAEAVYKYCRNHSTAEVAIGEGCGNGVTQDAFEANGYSELARRCGIRLIDFNEAKAVKLRHPDTLQLKELYIPEICRDAFIISLPVPLLHRNNDRDEEHVRTCPGAVLSRFVEQIQTSLTVNAQVRRRRVPLQASRSLRCRCIRGPGRHAPFRDA